MAAAAPADAIAYPYISALSRQSGGNRVYFCAGALVAPRWILTAAHCFHARDGSRIPVADLWAVVGRDRLREAEPEAQLRIDRIVILPGYDQSAQDRDLALVRLEAIAGPLVADATAAGGNEPDAATAIGFGSLYEGMLARTATLASGAPASQLFDTLQRTRLRLIPPEACFDAERPGTDSRLCATGERDAACVGDSGGPLVVEAAEGPDRLLGILSVGTGCAVAEPHLGYTPVAPHARWIAETISAD